MTSYNADLQPEYIRITAMEWRIRISEEVLSEEEQLAFEQWRSEDPRHADAYDKAVTLWSAYGTLNKSDINPELFPKKTSPWLPQSMLQAFFGHGKLLGAAGAFIIAGLTVFLLLQYASQPAPTIESSAAQVTRHASPIAELREIVLSDQSSVTLGPNSEIQVAMSANERKVNLISGAAMFNVTKDSKRPFFVSAGHFSVRVLGTIFDVRNSGGIVRLSVSEGVVEAAHPFVINQKPTSLTSRKQVVAGQNITATKRDGLMPVSTFSVDSFASWRSHRLKYDDANLAELIADANRYSARPIVLDASLDSIEDLTVTFSFDGNNVTKMLSALPALFPIEVDQSNSEKIIIRAHSQTNDSE